MGRRFRSKWGEIEQKCVKYSSKILLNLTISEEEKKKNKIGWAVALILNILIISRIVYWSGGTTSLIHLLYIPIIVSVFVFGIKQGIACAIFSGLLVGPYMPYNVELGIMQTPEGWILRLVMFVAVVFVVGELVNYIKDFNDTEKKKAYEDIFSGYPNFNKWKHDFTNMRQENSEQEYVLVLFEFKNLDTISRCVDYDIGRKAFKKLLEMAEEYFAGEKIYSINSDSIMLVTKKEESHVYKQAKNFLHATKQPIYIKGIPVAAVLKGSLISILPNHGNIDTIMKRLEKALEQLNHSKKDILIYNEQIAQRSKDHYAMLVSIYDAVQMDSFHLVYQPKVGTADNKMVGVEALLRWENEEHKGIPISQVIRIAEDAEFIGQITKWVIRHVVMQIKEWKEQGREINVALNLSAKDLNDVSILEYTKECLEEYQIDPKQLEFELTERTMIEDEERVFQLLNEFKNLGIRISLDDYGTGHNSLMYLVKSLFQFDSIKIDKTFVDEIESENTKILIAGVIQSAHGQGIKLVAEGVETKTQVEVLKAIGCDIIQGYYFSRPLTKEGILDWKFNGGSCE